MFGGRPDFYKRSLEVLNAASADDVVETARSWLSGSAIAIEVQPYPEELTAEGAGADRTRLPIPQTFPQAPFPAMHQATLSNGMRLIVAERRAVPVVQFTLQMNAGYAADQFASPGTANLAMEMLDEGTETLNALEISDSLARLGAQLSSGSNLDVSQVSLSALKENLDASLDIYADVILNPAFAPEELERLRRLQIAQIQQEKNTPQSMALRVVPQLLYGEGHAYSLPLTGSGTEEAVAALTREDLVKFHETWFKPNNATMIVVGDTTLAEIQPKLEALFAAWERGGVPAKTLPAVALPPTPRVFLIDRPGAEQSIVIAGQVIAPKREEDDIAVDAMNDILGGNFTSRINMNLREDKAWSYGARTMILDTMAQRPFIVYAPVQTDQTAPSMTEILREMSEYGAERGATEQEVATSKKRSTLTLPGRWETARSVAADIQDLVRFGLPDDYWNEYAELVERLTVTEVNAAARMLAPGQLTWVIVGDLRRIGTDIRALEFGAVSILDADGKPIDSR